MTRHSDEFDFSNTILDRCLPTRETRPAPPCQLVKSSPEVRQAYGYRDGQNDLTRTRCVCALEIYGFHKLVNGFTETVLRMCRPLQPRLPTPPHRTGPHRTAPYRTVPHRTAACEPRTSHAAVIPALRSDEGEGVGGGGSEPLQIGRLLPARHIPNENSNSSGRGEARRGEPSSTLRCVGRAGPAWPGPSSRMVSLLLQPARFFYT